MGLFLSLSGIIGKTQGEVVESLAKYMKSVGGRLQKEQSSLGSESNCVIEEAEGNTTVLYPGDFSEWDKSSDFISKDLNAPVFSCHIHDGDLWMYILYVNGELIDQFNPVPDYWDEDLSQEEIDSWKGNAARISRWVRDVEQADIEKYLVRWELEEENFKSYPDDEFMNEDWQLLDFIKKLGLPYPLDDEGKAKGEIYKILINTETNLVS